MSRKLRFSPKISRRHWECCSTRQGRTYLHSSFNDYVYWTIFFLIPGGLRPTAMICLLPPSDAPAPWEPPHSTSQAQGGRSHNLNFSQTTRSDKRARSELRWHAQTCNGLVVCWDKPRDAKPWSLWLMHKHPMRSIKAIRRGDCLSPLTSLNIQWSFPICMSGRRHRMAWTHH